MITDALVNFIPIGSNLPILGVPVRSNVYDILGSGPGTPPANIIGNRTIFSSDLGIGGKRAQMEVLIGIAFATGTSLNIAFQAALISARRPTSRRLDDAGGNRPILTANLTAAQVCARFDWPPAFPAGFRRVI